MEEKELVHEIKSNFDKRLTAVEQRLANQDQMSLTNSEHIIALQKAVSDIASDTKLNASEIKHMNMSMTKLEGSIQTSATKVESTVTEIWRTLSGVKDSIGPAIKDALAPVERSITALETRMTTLSDYKNQQIGSVKVWVFVGAIAATALSTFIGKLIP